MTTRRALLILLATSGSAAAQDCIWNQLSPATSPPARFCGTMVYDPARACVVLFGGRNGLSGPLRNDTWEWDGTTWTLKAITGPVPRFDHAMTYHPGLNRTILFGGYTNGAPDPHTWQWDGVQWTTLPADNSAYIPSGACMAFDAAHGRMILYGGTATMTGQPLTREMDPTGLWNPVLITTPPWRYGPSAVYNPDRGRIVMFGGSPLNASSEVWEFDGAGAGSWTLLGQGPPARYNAAMAYDPIRHRMVVAGGQGSAGTLGDVWEGDGLTWTRRADDGPAQRKGPCMAFDIARSAMIYFGGGEYPISHNDTWRFDGANTQSVIILGAAQNPPGQIFAGTPATITVTATGATGYQWFRQGVPLTNGGNFSGVTTPTLSVSSIARSDSAFSLTIYGVCTSVTQGVNFNVTDPLGCYPNCDHSTTNPYLTANDFQCFLNKFSAADSFANCDGSAVLPILNANDFQCFLSKFGAGCE